MIRKYTFREHQLSKLFFTADTHFGHANIIKYENRPFDTVEEMNAGLIENWNKKVPEYGTVFVLGDFCWRKKGFFEKLNHQLNGDKIFIKGNHDHGKEPKKWPYVIKIKIKDSRLKYGNTVIVCSHCPFETWEQIYYGSWHLHGHVHSRGWLKDIPLRHNVGVDINNYCPISYEEIFAKFKDDLNHEKD